MSIFQVIISLVLIVIVDCQNPTSFKQYTLQDSHNYYPCQQIGSIPITQFYGSTIFSQDLTPNQVKHITITGWFFLNSIADSNFYALFTIEEQQYAFQVYLGYVKNSPSSILFVLQTNSQTALQQYLSLANQWIWIKTDVYQSSSNTIKTDLRIYKNGMIQQKLFQSSVTIAPIASALPLQKQKIIITIGYLNDNSSQSCAIIKDVQFYWQNDLPQFNNDPTNSFFSYDITYPQTYLYQYYDFFYSSQNQGFILGQGQNYQNIVLSHQRVQASEIIGGEIIKSDFININEEKGLIINFQAKISTSSLSFGKQTTLLKIQHLEKNYKIQFQNQNIINFEGNIISNVDLSKWNHFLLVIKYSAKQIFLIIRGYENQQIQIAGLEKLPIYRILFGDTSNSETIFVQNIRIYKGTYVITQQSNCDYLIDQTSQQCLFCSSTYYLDFQNKMKCSLPSNPTSPTEIDQVSDWNNRNICGKKMVNLSSNLCLCLSGFYLNNLNQCQKCQRYCKKCSLTSCEKDVNRNNQGKCPSNRFDDGYTCILPALAQQNQVPSFYYDKNFNQQKTTFTFKNNLSLYIEFDMKLTSSMQFIIINANNFQFRIKDTNARIEFNNGPYYFTLFLNTWVRIGVLLQNDQIAYVTYQNGQPLLEMNTINSSMSQIDLDIGNYSSCSNICLRNLKIIQNSLTNKNNIQDYIFQLIVSEEQNIFSSFQLDTTQYKYNYLSKDTIGNYELYFPDSLSDFGINSGYTFTNDHYGYIQNVSINQNRPLSFFMTIKVNKLLSQTSLLEYSIGIQHFEVYLVPNNVLEIIYVRICFDKECHDTNYSYFYMNEVSFLMIYSLQQTPLETQWFYQQFEIVCNYRRETLTFMGSMGQQQFQIDKINIGKQSLQADEYNYIINKISFIQGNSYIYYNYYNDQSCFLQINIQNPICLYLKQQYVKCNGVVMQLNDCNNIADKSDYYYYHNQFTQSMLTTNILKDKCKSVAFDQLKDRLICLECTDQNFNEDTDCYSCNDGYYLDLKDQCQECDSICQTCINNSKYCLSCKTDKQIPPFCNCINENFYYDGVQCQNCSVNCDACFEESSLCIKCKEKRINPPFCQCNQMYYTEIGGECVEILCNKQCNKCVNDENNCTVCSQNRENPPECSCSSGYKEMTDGSCQQCQQSYYLDDIQDICLPCTRHCTKCDKYGCIECENGFVIHGKICRCPKEEDRLQRSEYNEICLKNLQVNAQVQFQDNIYFIVLIFTEDLVTIDFQENPLTSLILIYFPQLSNDSFTYGNPKIEKNKITIELIVLKNIAVKSGQILFFQNKIFMNLSKTFMLSEDYLYEPLSFEIGPFIFKKEDLLSSFDSINQVMNNETKMGQYTLQIFQNFQIVFYILNTLQPTSIFLLLKAEFPPNLYKFYQTIGKLIFPTVPEYQTNNYKSEFSFFGLEFSKEEVQLSTIQPFKKLGFSTTLLANIPLLALKYFLLFFSYTFINFLRILIHKPICINQLKRIQGFIIQRLNAENEVNLLSLLLNVLHQFYLVNQENWYIRQGVYISSFFIIMLIASFYLNYHDINHKIDCQNAKIHSILFIERIRNVSSLWKRNYFLFQLVKKYIVVTIVFFLYNFPIHTCILCSLVFFISGTLTIILEPYKRLFSRILKVVGEAILSAVWVLHIVIIKIERKIYENNIIDDEIVQKYQLYGLIIILSLIFYNLIFFIEFLASLYLLIKSLFKKKNKDNKQLNLLIRQPLKIYTPKYNRQTRYEFT